MGADGSQLCVWPELWLRVRPGRDGETEGREGRRGRHCLGPINFWGGGRDEGR